MEKPGAGGELGISATTEKRTAVHRRGGHRALAVEKQVRGRSMKRDASGADEKTLVISVAASVRRVTSRRSGEKFPVVRAMPNTRGSGMRNDGHCRAHTQGRSISRWRALCLTPSVRRAGGRGKNMEAVEGLRRAACVCLHPSTSARPKGASRGSPARCCNAARGAEP